MQKIHIANSNMRVTIMVHGVHPTAHLDKVYIAPVATQYHPYLAKLLSGTDVKIELSGNPYRQT